jgi:ribosomal protein S18 acetylase RimI-like enzyme
MSFEFVTENISEAFDADLVFPDGLSFFGPYLQYFVKEILETGGEAYVSRGSDGTLSGLFIYDNAEKTGTIFTRSREVFDYFYELKPFNFLFSELGTERESDAYDIYTIDLDAHPIVHRFGHEISMAQERNVDELSQFMLATHPGMNGKWVRVALSNGERCFVVRLGDEIAGVGWASLVKGIGRLHSLFVRPQFRRMGIGEDILYARLLWLKSMRAHSAFSEISRHNHPSSRVAAKGHMTSRETTSESVKNRFSSRDCFSL